MKRMHLAAALMTGLFLTQWAGAIEIYRWEDEKGQVHVSDVVPKKYRNSATRIEVRTPSAEPAESAKPKAAEVKSAAPAKPEATPAVPAQPNAKETAAKDAAPKDATPKDATPKDAAEASTDCETLLRQYRESLECFAPYRTATGGIKAEAFEKCKELPDPSDRCPQQKAQ